MIRNININPVLNGFVLSVGCQTVVFESVDKLIDNLRDYLRDPEKAEKTFITQAINRKHTLHDPPLQPGSYPQAGIQVRPTICEDRATTGGTNFNIGGLVPNCPTAMPAPATPERCATQPCP